MELTIYQIDAFMEGKIKLWQAFTGSEVQGSAQPLASGLKSGRFDQKTDSSVVESDTRVKDKEGIKDPKSFFQMALIAFRLSYPQGFLADQRKAIKKLPSASFASLR